MSDEHDARLTSGGAVTVRRNDREAERLLSALPTEEYPLIDSEPKAWRYAAGRWLDDRDDGPGPRQIVVEGDATILAAGRPPTEAQTAIERLLADGHSPDALRAALDAVESE